MGHPAKGARLAKTIKAAGEVKAAGEGACAPRLGKEFAQFFSPVGPKAAGIFYNLGSAVFIKRMRA